MNRGKKFLEGALLAAGLAGLSACTNLDTGGTLVRFHAYAAGRPGVNGTAEFDTDLGFHVVLTTARLHVGAVYLRLGQTNPGSANASCYGDTTYGLEVPGSVDVDALSDTLQEFSVLGDATSDVDRSGELWLVGGDLDQVEDTTEIASVAGTATKNGVSYPFEGALTIGENHRIAPTDPAEPGANPICKQRIVAPIPTALRPATGGDFLLRVDPRPFWLDQVDFSTLAPSARDPAVFQIPDDGTPASTAFFDGVTSTGYQTGGPSSYEFSWFQP